MTTVSVADRQQEAAAAAKQAALAVSPAPKLGCLRPEPCSLGLGLEAWNGRPT